MRPFPLSSVAFANKVLQQLRRELSESDGSPLCQGTSFIIKPPGVSCRDPALEASVGHGHLAEVQDWDWRHWFAALPAENYDSFTGRTGILELGLRPIVGTVDPNGSGPIWDFSLVLDRQPPVTVHIHPGAQDTRVTRWSTRTDRERALLQTTLAAVNPDCGPESALVMYESFPLARSGFEASSSAAAVTVGGRTESSVGPGLAASSISWSLVPCDDPADEAGVVQFLVDWSPRAQQAKAACKQAARRRPEFRMWPESALPTIAELPTQMADWSSGSWSWWDQAGRWSTGVAPDGGPAEDRFVGGLSPTSNRESSPGRPQTQPRQS